MVLSLGVGAFADSDNESTTAGNDSSSIVKVTAEAATFKVTVPSVLAFHVAANGGVTAPSNMEIANESNGPVDVTGVGLNADCGWAIDANGQDYKTVPVNSKRLTLTLNGTNAPATAAGNESSFGTLSREDGYWPVILGNDSLDITAAADFAEQGTSITTAEGVVHVVYTIAWHTGDDGIEDEEPEDVQHVVDGVIQDSWDDIIAAVNNGSYDEIYSIGDKKLLDLGTEGEVYMQIVAFDADELADGNGTAPITWISEQTLATAHHMNPSYSAGTEGTGSFGGWEKSDMRTYLRDTIKPLIPSNVRNAIKYVTKYSFTVNEYNMGVNNVASTDDVWIPSSSEVGAKVTETEGPTYTDFFTDSATRVKKRVGTSTSDDWWLRSACGNEGFAEVFWNSGNWYYYNADFDLGVALGFCT